MANKPDKFGIKFWLAVDTKAKYILNAFPYLGKDDTRPTGQPLGEYVVLKLLEPYTKKGRNVTTDNFFTSLELAKKLAKLNTTIVGTVNRSRKEIPEVIKNSKGALYETVLFTSEDNVCTLTAYQAKANKNVLLLSTQHQTVSIDAGTKKKPETILFYNSTKYGVDVVDQMARKYSVKAPSRRWPVHVLYNILDFAAINAFVIYKDITGNKIKRRDFILQLAEQLSQKAHNQEEDPQEGTSTQKHNNNLEVGSKAYKQNRKRRTCQEKKCENKTYEICKNCKKNICGKCSFKITYCNNCNKI